MALGALVSRLIYLPSRRPPRRVLGWLYINSTLLCYLTIPLTVWFTTLKFYGYWFGLIPLFLAACLFGGIFPLLVKASDIRDEEAGSAVALLSGANIMGSLTGSLAAGFYLMDLLPLARASALSALFGLFCALLCFPLSRRSLRAAMPFVLFLAVAAGVITSNEILHKEMYKKLMYMPRHVVKQPFQEVIENRSGVICLSEEGVVFGDGAYDGRLSTDLYPKTNAEIELAYLSFLFKPEPKRILVVGLATGAWTQVLAQGPGVESVTAVEINPGYLELIQKNREVASLLTNPKVEIVIDDGRRWLDRNPHERFDYIVLNTTFHWRSGATSLLSREFFSLVKSRLNPGGVALINTTGSEEVAATAAEAFDHLAAYGIYLFGSDAPFEMDKEKFTRVMGAFRVEGEQVLDLSVPEEAEALAYYLKLDYLKAGERWRDRAAAAGIITDDNMLTEFNSEPLLCQKPELLFAFQRRFHPLPSPGNQEPSAIQGDPAVGQLPGEEGEAKGLAGSVSKYRIRGSASSGRIGERER